MPTIAATTSKVRRGESSTALQPYFMRASLPWRHPYSWAGIAVATATTSRVTGRLGSWASHSTLDHRCHRHRDRHDGHWWASLDFGPSSGAGLILRLSRGGL